MANEWQKTPRARDGVSAATTWTSCESRKAEVGEQLDRSRSRPGSRRPRHPAPGRPPGQTIGEPLLEQGQPRERPRSRPAARRNASGPGLAPDAPRPEDASYTNRLLKAKQRVWEEREKDREKEKEKPGRKPDPGARRAEPPSGRSHPGSTARLESFLSCIIDEPRQYPTKGSPSMADASRESMEARAEEFRTAYNQVKAEIAKVIVGHDEIVHGVLTCLFIGGHALLEGVPGLGKTLLVRTLADALDLDFNRIQFTPDLMPADIIGTNVVMEAPDGRRVFEFQARADLLADRPGRRDQPRHAQDPVGPARGDAGALGHRGRQHPPAQGAVLRDGHAEPDRAGGDLSAARGPARPVPASSWSWATRLATSWPRSSTARPGATAPGPRR